MNYRKYECLDYIFLHRNRFELTNDISVLASSSPIQQPKIREGDDLVKLACPNQ